MRDRLGKELGHFRSKFFSLGGGFQVLDASDNPVAEIKGDWKGWNFRFLSRDGIELGKVTKQWAGLGKELFTSADNYIIALDEGRALPRTPPHCSWRPASPSIPSTRKNNSGRRFQPVRINRVAQSAA